MGTATLNTGESERAMPDSSRPADSSNGDADSNRGLWTAIRRFFELPATERPNPRDCIFLATHEPCSLCLSGITWSGFGKIAKVEISFDGGTSWTEAEMPGPIFPQCVTRFRLPWEWDGKAVVVQSRATDEKGNVQPTRAVWKDRVSSVQFYQYNAIQAWQIGADNTVKNIYV